MTRRHAIRLAPFAAVAVLAFVAGACAQGSFPNIREAQDHLAAAFRAVERTPPGRFGGHRDAALADIRAAQGELDAGLRDFH